VYEQTLKRLAEQGEVAYATGGQVLSRARMGSLPGAFGDLVAAGAARPGRLYIAASPELLGFVGTGFGEVLGPAQVRRIGGLLEVPGLLEELEEAPLGYMPRDLAPYTRLGLHPLLRLRNYPGMAASGLRAKMARLAQLGRGYPVVFDKTEVLGYAGLIPQTAAALQSAQFPYGRIEVFSVRRKQRGEDQLAALMRPHVIRLFSLTADELLALTPESVRDKFVLAARERNIRILYLRPILPTAGNVGTNANLVLLDQITGDLTRFGLRPGPARAFPDIRIPRVLMLGVILGALAAIALALMPLGRAVGIAVPEKVAWALVGIGIVVSLLTMTGGLWVLWRKILALGTASAVPVLAVAGGRGAVVGVVLAAVALPLRGPGGCGGPGCGDSGGAEWQLRPACAAHRGAAPHADRRPAGSATADEGVSDRASGAGAGGGRGGSGMAAGGRPSGRSRRDRTGRHHQ